MSTTAIPTPDPTSAAWSIYLDSQSFNLTSLDGTPVTLNLTEINYYIYDGAVTYSAYGFSLGFASMLAIVLFLLTDAKKLRRPIMLLNALSLILFSIRAVGSLVVGLHPSITNIAPTFLGAVAQYGVGSRAGGIVTAFVNPPLYVTIMASLILQVRVVFGPEPRVRFFVTIFLSAIATVLAVFQIMYAVYIMIYCVQMTELNSREPAWLYPTIKIFFLIFLGLASLIFLYKLAMTIRMRRRLGLTRFGPLQILFIMSVQCLVVPLIFYILTYTAVPVLQLVGIGQAFIVCSLPLSTLWASAEAASPQQLSELSNARSTATSNVTVDSQNTNKFLRFWRNKKPSPDSHSSYSDDIEKSPKFSPAGVQIHTTLQVESFDRPGY